VILSSLLRDFWLRKVRKPETFRAPPKPSET
jgi:hypothetical protein